MGPAASSPILVLDTETTGLLDQRHAAVVEVGAAAIDLEGRHPARVREVVSFLVNPGEAYLGPEADEALSINGITRVEIRAQGLAPPEAASRLGQAALEERPTAVAAFGVHFDKPMLARPPLGWTTPLPWVDVMLKAAEVMGAAGQLGRRADGSLKWPSLKEAALFFGVVNPRPHRAMADALTAARVLAAVLETPSGPQSERA